MTNERSWKRQKGGVWSITECLGELAQKQAAKISEHTSVQLNQRCLLYGSNVLILSKVTIDELETRRGETHWRSLLARCSAPGPVAPAR